MPAIADPVRTAYDALAPYYDDFVRGHDHEAWAHALEALARRHGLRGRRALDLGCGTGKSLAPLLARGYDATGCDLSREMLGRARARLPAGTRLLEADVRALEHLGCFDLIWCLSDGLNYVGAGELEDVFRGVERNLGEDGLLVFDVNTLWCYRRFFSAATVVACGDHVLVWDGTGDGRARSGARASATLTAYVAGEGGFWDRLVTVHEQQHHPQGSIAAALARASLRPVAVYGARLDGSLEAGLDEDRHSKAVYLARRGAPVEEGR
jgi:SAM-dependent methyltransferase